MHYIGPEYIRFNNLLRPMLKQRNSRSHFIIFHNFNFRRPSLLMKVILNLSIKNLFICINVF